MKILRLSNDRDILRLLPIVCLCLVLLTLSYPCAAKKNKNSRVQPITRSDTRTHKNDSTILAGLQLKVASPKTKAYDSLGNTYFLTEGDIVRVKNVIIGYWMGTYDRWALIESSALKKKPKYLFVLKSDIVLIESDQSVAAERRSALDRKIFYRQIALIVGLILFLVFAVWGIIKFVGIFYGNETRCLRCNTKYSSIVLESKFVGRDYIKYQVEERVPVQGYNPYVNGTATVWSDRIKLITIYDQVLKCSKCGNTYKKRVRLEK